MSDNKMRIMSLVIRGESGHDYVVATDANGAATCTCPSFRFNTRWCKHLAFVHDSLKLRVDA